MQVLDCLLLSDQVATSTSRYCLSVRLRDHLKFFTYMVEMCKQCTDACVFVYKWTMFTKFVWAGKCVVHKGRNVLDVGRDVSVKVCVFVEVWWKHFVLWAPVWNSLHQYLGVRANLRSAQFSDNFNTVYFSHSACNRVGWLTLAFLSGSHWNPESLTQGMLKEDENFHFDFSPALTLLLNAILCRPQ